MDTDGHGLAREAGRHEGTKARSVKPRPVVAVDAVRKRQAPSCLESAGAGRASTLKPQASSLKPSYHASADPQMHTWRDWKQRMAALVSF